MAEDQGAFAGPIIQQGERKAMSKNRLQAQESQTASKPPNRRWIQIIVVASGEESEFVVGAIPRSRFRFFMREAAGE